MKLFVTLALALGLIPAPVEYIPAQGVCVREKVVVKQDSKEFRKVTASLEPFQQKEAYRITVSPRKIKIEALTDEGFFRAGKSLEQLKAVGPIPCGVIFDYPRLRHRGLMIDESRSFNGIDFLKKQIDAMALLKLNVLHLHLDDSAGWRIYIDSYPDLTGKTAFRMGRTYHEWEAGKYKFTSADDPDGYGGYYSKEQLRELVEYAAQRFITVIPEIEMPGHSMEVGYAYPEVLCVHPNGKVHTGAWDLCPGSEATFQLLEAVLEEVIDIFLSPFIHIGGDEATMKTWPECVNCRKRMEEEGFTDVKQLQGYLVRRIEAFVRTHGRRIIGWDEILETGVPEGAVVQSWRGVEGGLKASAMGYDYIMSPNSHCYYNYYQDLIRKEPKAVGELVSLRFTYGYEPLADGMDPEHLLGVQANLWTELIPTQEHAEYMLYPRLFALAETAWSPSSAKEFQGFRERARALLDVFRGMGYNTFDMDSESELARSGFQRFEQLEKYKAQYETAH
ncbi:MAG: beta-N-acetylhexosaminidase [Bacteroidales bacterium]|nr:beta-N-acetylhexosaminidase [Bacteroidales bacterium]